MNEINGQYGGNVVRELLMDSGEIVYVQPLSIYLVRALQDKAQELFPFPDKTQYEKTLDDAKAIEPGQVIPAEDNPEYQKLYDIAAEKQQNYVNEKCIALSVEPVQGRQVMIKKYKARIVQMREMMTLPDDEWDATLRFCILTSRADFNKVTEAIMGRGLPREEEILNGMRIFRMYVRKETTSGSDTKEEPQSADTNLLTEPQPDSRVIQSGAVVGMADP